MVYPPAADSNQTAQQTMFAVARVHLLEQLRTAFEQFEHQLLQDGEQTPLCCELRRSRRMFIDSYMRQLFLRCEQPDQAWLIGSAASALHARTFIYLCAADEVVSELYREQAEGIGRLSALWFRHAGQAEGSVLDCPLAPHTLARLFFLLLSDVPAPLRIRKGLAQAFLGVLPQLTRLMLNAVFNSLQRRGELVASVVPQALPEWWEPLERWAVPSIAAQALVVPPALHERTLLLAHELARMAQVGDWRGVAATAATHRQSALLPWLADLLAQDSALPPVARTFLSLLAGPLLYAALEENFADSAHPARRVLEEMQGLAPGWQDCLGIDGVVAEQCRDLAMALAMALTEQPAALMSAWCDLLDYLLLVRKRVQQDTSAVVANARLSMQVMDVRAEINNLLRERVAQEYWPQVVLDILIEHWSALLLGIHWREGTASDAWLSALSVADELLASVLPGTGHDLGQGLLQRVPALLQNLRRGFDEIGCDRRTYSTLLDRLERVHLALLQGRPSVEPMCLWPATQPLSAGDQPFDVGCWLQQADGSHWSVVFSDPLCTVLLDAHSAGLMCCATASLQAEFYEGNLSVLPGCKPLLAA